MSINLRQLVSKNKKRFDDGSFNLDLSYITPQIIAMGFPAETLERIYRNDINEVAKMLETYHHDRYKVYNLCAERSYNYAKFNYRVEQFAMQDHNPPLIHTIPYFCNSVYKWLQTGTDYVAAIHCKAGKGRTGVMICCYLLYESYYGIHENPPTYLTAEQVLELYDEQRTYNKKGVTIPSQRRYVYYYAHMLRCNLTVESCPLVLKCITLEGGLPAFPPSGGCCLMFRCKKLVRDFRQDNRSAHRPIGASDICEPRKGQSRLLLRPSEPIPVNGDVKIEFYNRSKVLARFEKVFHFWLNTYFVLNQPQDTPGARWRRERQQEEEQPPPPQPQDQVVDGPVAAAAATTTAAAPGGEQRDVFLTLTKAELDKACKDRLFPDTFCVTLQFEVPDCRSDDDEACAPYRPFAYTPQEAGAAAAAAPPAAAAHEEVPSSSCSSQTDDDTDSEVPAAAAALAASACPTAVQCDGLMLAPPPAATPPPSPACEQEP